MTRREAPFLWTFELDRKSIRDVPDGAVWFRGRASDYSPDRDDELVSRDGLAAGLKAYLNSNPVLLLNHLWDKPIGRCTRAHVADDGLWIEGVLDPAPHPSSWQADVLAKVKSSTLRALSIGGRFFRDKPGVVTRVDLMEISLAAVGKNQRALISEVAGKAFAGAYDEAEELREIKANLAGMKEAFKAGGEKMFWSRRTEPVPNASTIYGNADEAGDLSRDWKRARSHRDQVESHLVDTGEPVVEEASTDAFWGIRRADSPAEGVRHFDLSADEVAGLFGAHEARDPRTLPGKSAIDVFGSTPTKRVAGMVEKVRKLERAKANA